MKIGSDEWINIVLEGADRMGVSVNAYQAFQFGRHAQHLMQWNRKINLTAITDPAQVAVKHYLDAIAPLSHIPAEGRLLDMGTGGGFPGIPLKIMRPDQSMTLIDSVRKKITFVKSSIHLLGLAQIEARHVRVQDMPLQNTPQVEFEVVVCRALAELEAVVAMAIPVLADDGRLVVYQGPQGTARNRAEEFSPVVDNRRYRFQLLSYSYQLPFTGDKRSVAVVTRI